LYVRLWTELGGSWTGNYADYTVTAAPFAAARAKLSSPSIASPLGGGTVTFTWTAGIAVSQYQLYVGSSAGATDYYLVAATTSLAATVTGIPTTGGSIYVRLQSSINGSWSYDDYSYTGATQSNSGPTLTTPTPSSTLTATTVTFTWTAGTNVTTWQLN